MFKIRCSAIADIMTNDRSGKKMGKTSQSWIEQWYKEQLYNRRKEFTSKYTDKGLSVEDDAIKYLSEVDKSDYAKNEVYFENDFMTGTPDVITPGHIIEIKSSWDCFTFPLFENEADKKYWWQCQGYMALTGKEKAVLTYVLMSAPEHIIDKEAWNEARKRGEAEVDIELWDEVKEKMSYEKYPASLRIKRFEIARDAEAITAIEQRVIECRQYLETIQINQ